MERTEPFPPVRIYHSTVFWNICNYFEHLNEVETVIESSEFVTDLRHPINWTLKIILKPAYDKLHLSGCILKRCPSQRGPSHIVVKTQLSLTDSTGIAWKDDSRDICFYRDNQINLIRSDDNTSCPIPYKDAIFITGNIRVQCDLVQDFPLHFLQSDTESDLWNLSNDFETFYMTGNLTDLDLKLGAETFPVHRAIVATRSHLIASKLNAQKRLRQISLPERISVPLIKGLIAYWYSGNLDKLPRTPSLYVSTEIQNQGHYELQPYVEPDNVEVTTNFKNPDISFNWVIKDSEFCEYLSHFNGRQFHVYKSENLPFNVSLYPKGVNGNADFISLIILNDNTIDRKVGYVEVFFKDGHGTEYGSEHGILRRSLPTQYEFPRFMRHDKFARIRGNLLNCNSLEIGFRMFFGEDNILYDNGRILDHKVLSYMKEHPYTFLAKDLKKLLETEDMSDIVLISRGKKIRAHSTILAARSRYFNELFITRREDETFHRTNEVVLEDIEPDDLDMILKYVYYAKEIVLNSELALRLYPVFCKYKITRLDNICSNYLKNNLSVENRLNILQLADAFNDESLKNAAEAFVPAN